MKKLAYILFLFIFTNNITAQTAKAFEEAGDVAFGQKDYSAALEYYLEAEAKGKNNDDLAWKMAETARFFNSYALAEKNYKKVIDAKLTKKYPTAKFQLALAKKAQGKYEEAKTIFEEVIGDPYTSFENMAQARKEMKSSDWAIGMTKTPKDVTIEHLGKSVNSPYSDFGAVKHDETLYFSSLRFENKEDKRNPPRLLTKVLSTKDTLIAAKALPKYNSATQHTAYSAFSPKNERVYFTNCDYGTTGDEIVCSIFFREKQGETWSKEERLPDFINFAGASNTMPFVALEKGEEILYFASNRKDGKGGYDIWSSTILPTGGFSYPVNLAFINTAGDEMSPYFHAANKTLYFSSNGYETLGGLDIFSSVKNKSSFSTPRNMGVPINSSYNDLYFNMLADGKEGYLASNRLGSQFLDKKNETCCYDVYKAIIGKKVLEEPKKDIPKTTDVPKKDVPPTTTSSTPPKNTTTNTPPKSYDNPPTKDPKKDVPPTTTSQKVPPPGYKPPPPNMKFDIPTKIPKDYKEYTELDQFLPLPLYFDNDEPDRNTRATTTSKTYEQAENVYYKRKYEYIEKNLAVAGNRKTAIESMDLLFEETVHDHFIQLQKFTPILLGRLYKGEKIEIIVKGFASPLAKNDYNNNLGKRRVASLVNFWKNYEDGLFQKYFENGQLKITQVSFGEDTAAQTVSDDDRNEAASIYSVGAAKERRIEIIEIKKN